MSAETLSLSVSIYQSKADKDKAVQMVKVFHKDHAHVTAAIAIEKEMNGKINYKDIGMSPTKGALSGLVIGTVIGILTGGIGLALGTAGGLIGGLIGSKKYQKQFSEVRLHEVVASLKPGCSAIVAIVQKDSLAELEKNFSSLDVEFFNAELSDDLIEKLEHEKSQNDHTKWMDKITR